jgi:hypothetical protein
MSEPKVYVSYSHDDADWARRFAEALQQQSVNVWFDAWQIQSGELLPDAIEAGLRGSDAIVSILTLANARRPNVLFELGVAVGMGKRVISIVPADLDSSVIPFELRKWQHLTKGAPDQAAREVAEALRGKAA